MGDHAASVRRRFAAYLQACFQPASYRASSRYRGVWAAFRAASPGLGPVGGVLLSGGSSPPDERAVSAWDVNGDPRRIARFGACWRGTGRLRFSPRSEGE
jgi:hypothetical protein